MNNFYLCNFVISDCYNNECERTEFNKHDAYLHQKRSAIVSIPTIKILDKNKLKSKF